MKKRILLATSILTIALALSACGEKADNNKSSIVDNEPNTATTQTTQETAASEEKAAINPTLAPAATAAPDSAEKADAKIAEGGSANAAVEDNGTTREVDLQFQIKNETGIDFVAMLLEPVTAELAKGANRFPKDFVFKNGATINVAPPTDKEGNNYVLDTTLFNLAAIDAKGTGYVFQNLDLASCKHMTLQFEDGVPKAIVK